MKNKKVKIAYLLTTFIFLFTYIGGLLGTIESYAYDNTYVALVSSNKPTYKSSKKSYSTKSKTAIKPSSGSFTTKSKNNSSTSKKNNINSGSYSSIPNTTTIKPDSGSFSTKPNTNSSNSSSSSTIKPDSGSFSTTPKNNSNSSKNNNTNSNNNDKTYGGSTYSRPIFRGSYYGGYSPFRRVFFGYGMSSWIIKLVLLITAIVVIYIIIDYIRSRRD